MGLTDYGTLVDNFSIPQGADFSRLWPVTDTNGHPVDVTGWTVDAQVRTSPDSATVLYEWSSALGNATADTAGITIKTSKAVTLGWTWRIGFYDVLLTTPNGTTTTRGVQGQVTVNAGVTR